MNHMDVEPRLAPIEIFSDFREKLLIAGRLNEKVPRPVFRRFAGAAPRAHFTHPRFPNRNCLPNERTKRNPKTILSLKLFQQTNQISNRCETTVSIISTLADSAIQDR